MAISSWPIESLMLSFLFSLAGMVRTGVPWKPLVKDDRASVGLDHWMTVCSRATLQYGACFWTTMVNFCCVPAIRPLGCVGYSCLAYQTGFIPYGFHNKIFLGMECSHSVFPRSYHSFCDRFWGYQSPSPFGVGLREAAGSLSQFNIWSSTIEACVYVLITLVPPPFHGSQQMRKF